MNRDFWQMYRAITLMGYLSNSKTLGEETLSTRPCYFVSTKQDTRGQVT